MFVCHRCDTPRCVNPDHLFIGTPADNVADMIAKGRKVTASPKGADNGKALLNPEKVRLIRSSDLSNAELGRRLGVSINAVRGVRTGRTWGHVT